jgi:protein ImuB
MKRFVSVWLPRFAIERMARARPGAVPPDKACVLIESGRHGLVLTAVNERAERDGLRPGLRLADARAAIPDLVTRAAEPDADARHLHALARSAGRYGPNRNTEGTDGIWIETTGVAHLFGGEGGLARDLVERFRCAGFTTRIGIADTPGAAFALARHAHTGRSGDGASPLAPAPPGQTQTVLAGCPVEALRLSEATLVLLKRLGLRRIGQLYALPRAALVRRFRDVKGRGLTGGARAGDREELAEAVVGRLDQVLGRTVEPLQPLAEPPLRLIQKSYPDGLITHEGIMSALGDLAVTLCNDLDGRDEGVRRLRLSLFRVDNTATEIVIGTSRASRDATHLVRMLEERLSDLDAGFGIDMMALAALHVAPLTGRQTQLDSGSAERHAQATAHLVDRLANRLGADRIFRLATVESHIPERAQRRQPVDGMTGRRVALTPPNRGTGAVRPPFLLSRPEPIDVVAEIPDGPPARFRWRRISRRVIRANGPERIAPEWWRQIDGRSAEESPAATAHAARVRDYYEIEDERGGRYWVYRAGLYDGGEDAHGDRPPMWFVHGLFG